MYFTNFSQTNFNNITKIIGSKMNLKADKVLVIMGINGQTTQTDKNHKK